MSGLEYTRLTAPFDLFSFDLQTFEMGQVPSDLEQEVTLDVDVVKEGRPDVLLFWYDIYLTPDVVVSSWDEQYNFHQAALYLEPLTSLYEDRIVRLGASFKHETLSARIIDVKRPDYNCRPTEPKKAFDTYHDD